MLSKTENIGKVLFTCNIIQKRINFHSENKQCLLVGKQLNQIDIENITEHNAFLSKSGRILSY